MRHKHLYLFVALLASIGCIKQPADEVEPARVATVNGQPIYAYEVHRSLRSYGQQHKSQAVCQKVAAAILDDMIQQRILLAQADKEKIQVSPEEMSEAIKKTTQAYRPYEFQRVLDHVYLSPQMLSKRIEARLRIERLLEAHVAPVPPPSEASLRQFFAQHIKSYKQDEQVRVRQILLRSREEAEQLKLRTHKESFAELARKYSVAPEASRGGDLGYFTKGTMPAIFDQVCFSLKRKEISDVIVSDYGFHLFQLVDRKAAGQADFDKLRDQVKKQLIDSLRTEAAQKYLDTLVGQAKITKQAKELELLCAKISASEDASVKKGDK